MILESLHTWVDYLWLSRRAPAPFHARGRSLLQVLDLIEVCWDSDLDSGIMSAGPGDSVL
jgi:hypothetical protein